MGKEAEDRTWQNVSVKAQAVNTLDFAGYVVSATIPQTMRKQRGVAV